MISPRPESTDSSGPGGSDSTHRQVLPGDEGVAGSCDTARVGVITCILFMAGGLYWTASVGLLTISALTAYPVMISIGILLSLVMFGATFWALRGSQSGPMPHSLSQESDAHGMNTYDAVTGLPTKRLFVSLLNQALSHAQMHGRQVAVLMIELGHFTPESDVQAQVNANLMYRVQAARVKSALRTTDTVARLGERTFVVLLDQVTAPDEVIATARKMQATISLPVLLDGHELFLTSRVGISLSTYDGVESGTLVEAATRALGTARAEGHAIYGFHGAIVTASVDSVSDSVSTIAA